MAVFNNGFPLNYTQGYYPPQIQIQQQQNNGLIWVQGESSAKSYPVAPNSSVALWDSEGDIIYIKSVDASGMPSLKILDYTVRNNTPQKAEISPQTSFATKDELLTIKEELSALKAKFELIDNTADNRKEYTDAK